MHTLVALPPGEGGGSPRTIPSRRLLTRQHEATSHRTGARPCARTNVQIILDNLFFVSPLSVGKNSDSSPQSPVPSTARRK